MDAVVAQAMARWPNVPAVYGWLSLDRRGNWLIKGERIANHALREFIARNYEADENGRRESGCGDDDRAANRDRNG